MLKHLLRKHGMGYTTALLSGGCIVISVLITATAWILMEHRSSGAPSGVIYAPDLDNSHKATKLRLYIIPWRLCVGK